MPKPPPQRPLVILLMALACVLSAWVVSPWDEALVRWFHAASDQGGVLLFLFDRWVPRIVLTFSVVVGVHVWLRGPLERRPDGLVLMIGPLLANGVTGILKDVFARPRPQVALSDLEVAVRLADARSLPSGHVTTIAAFALALMFLVRGRRRFVAIPLVPLTMWDRVALAVHHPSDTLVALAVALLVMVSLRAVVHAVRPAPPPRWWTPILFFVAIFVTGMTPDPLVARDPGSLEPLRVLDEEEGREVPRFRMVPRTERLVFEPFLGPPLHAATWDELRERLVEMVGLGFLVLTTILVASRDVRRGVRIRRLLLFFLLGIFWALGFLSGRLPADRFEAPHDEGVFADLHRHGSDPVDDAHGRRPMLLRARARNVDVVAFTNHDAPPGTVWGIPAMEWSGRRHPDAPFWHLLIFGGDGAFDAALATSEPLEAVRVAKARGATVVVAHPWTWLRGARVTPPSWDALVAAGVDGFEVANRTAVSGEGRAVVRAVDALCRERGLLRLSVTDAHGIPAGSPCVTFLSGIEAPDVATRERAVLARLAARGPVIPLVFAAASETPRPGLLRILRPVLSGLNYFRALSWAQRMSWVFWCFLLWPWLRREGRRGAD